MRKILTIIMLTLLLTVSCGKPEAQKILEKDLNALQSGEITNITGISPNSKEFSNTNSEMSAAFANAYKKLTYKVTKTKVEGDTATMNVDLKIPELASYFPEYFQKAMELSFSASNGKEEDTKAKIKNLSKEFFEEKLNSKDLKYFEKNVEVVFKKEGNEWKFDEGNSKNKDFLDGLTLGFASILEKINKDNKNDGK